MSRINNQLQEQKQTAFKKATQARYMLSGGFKKERGHNPQFLTHRACEALYREDLLEMGIDNRTLI